MCRISLINLQKATSLMLALVHVIASVLPVSLLAWGMSYALLVRRRGLAAPRRLIAAHYFVVTGILAGFAATFSTLDYGVQILFAVVISLISCSLLAGSSSKPVPEFAFAPSNSYVLGNRVSKFLSRPHLPWVFVAAAAALCVTVYWVGYPWTYAQCLRWAARQPTNNGVAVALNHVCSEMQPHGR